MEIGDFFYHIWLDDRLNMRVVLAGWQIWTALLLWMIDDIQEDLP